MLHEMGIETGIDLEKLLLAAPARRSESSAARSAPTRCSPARSTGSAEPVFDRVLIANRGEIAVRVDRTLRRLGIESIAVFSDADAGAPHVRGGRPRRPHRPDAGRATPTSRSSASSTRRAQPAPRRSTPATASSPSAPTSPRACADAGLVFVGPGPEAMALLGDKVRGAGCGRRGRGAGPAGPGAASELSDEEIVELGPTGAELPLLVKAAAGGGGKGMRVVDATATSWPRRWRGAARGGGAPSATTGCWSSATSRPPATSRCRCSPTPTATRSTSASASAACSAATRRWSRSRPRRSSAPRAARARWARPR